MKYIKAFEDKKMKFAINIDFAQKLIDENLIEIKNRDGNTLLNLASYHANVSVAKLLIDAGADVNTKNINGNTPLINSCSVHVGDREKEISIMNKKFKISELLIDAGADVNTKNNDKQTALLEASYYAKSNSIIKLLVDNGANVHYSTPLIYSILNGNIEITKTLIECGVDVNKKTSTGGSSLGRAAYYLRNEQIKLLIDAGVNLNIQDNHGDTPLIELLQNYKTTPENRFETIKILINAGSNVDLRDSDNKSFFDYISKKYKIKIIEETILMKNDIYYKWYLEKYSKKYNI